MDGAFQLVYSSGYRNLDYPHPDQDDQTSLRYICGYCTNDSTRGYYVTLGPTSQVGTEDWLNWTGLNNKTDLAFNETTICEISNAIDGVMFKRYILLPAALIISILSFLLQRRRLSLQCCSGRPGLIFPVNLVDYQKHRFTYAAIFTLSAWHMLFMIFNTPPFYLEEMDVSQVFTDPPWIQLPNARPFFVAIGCIQFAFIYYPIFATLSSHHLIGYLMGTLYTWTMAAIFALDEALCPQGKSTEIVVLNYLYVAPPMLCLLYLVIIFPVRAVQEMLETQQKVKTYPSSGNLFLTESEYVKELFYRNKQPPSPTHLSLSQRVMNKIYTPTKGFKYSVSVLTGTLMGICFAYMVFIGSLKLFHLNWMTTFETRLQPAIKAAHSNNCISEKFQVDTWCFLLREFEMANQTCMPFANRAILWLDTIKSCYFVSAILAFVNIVVGLFLAMKNYKSNMLMVYKGQQGHIQAAEDYSPRTLLLAAAKYVGFQAAYSTWGYVIQSFLLFAIFAGISAFFNLLCQDTIFTVFISVIQYFWITIAVIIVVSVTQYLMGRFLFLLKNEKGESVLALDNRRLYFNFNYFTIFSNTALGIISCLIRILKAFILGLYNLPRLDVSILNRHLEWFDTSFMCFVGLLYMENAHRNPTMLVALGFFMDGHMKRHTDFGSIFTEAKNEKPKRPFDRRHTLARNRWQLAWMLYKNPKLRSHRKGDLTRMEVRFLYEKTNARGSPPPTLW